MNIRTYISQSIQNKLYSYVIMVSLMLLLVLIGYVFAGGPGVYFVLSAVITFMLFGPGVSPRFVMKLYRGRYLTPQSAPGLYDIAAKLSRDAGLTAVPDLYYLPVNILNAFALGTSESSAIALTDGMLRRMNHREMAGVIAHEISHIANKDTNVTLFSGAIGKVIGILSIVGQAIVLINLPLVVMGAIQAPWIPVMILALAPGLSGLLQLAHSRIREYDADLSAVKLTGDPRGLASALEKIEYSRHGFLRRLFTTGYSVNRHPLFSTHPVTGERVRRLLALAGGEHGVGKCGRSEGYSRVYQKYFVS